MLLETKAKIYRFSRDVVLTEDWWREWSSLSFLIGADVSVWGGMGPAEPPSGDSVQVQK
jgi:hypothetical protein